MSRTVAGAKMLIGLCALVCCGCGSVSAESKVLPTTDLTPANICGQELLPGPRTVARMRTPDVKAMLQKLEGPNIELCPAATVVVAVHGSPDEVVRMILLVRDRVHLHPVARENTLLLAGGILGAGHNLRFHEPEFSKRVVPVLAQAATLGFWTGSGENSDPSTVYTGASLAISALGDTGLPAALDTLKSLLGRPNLEAEYQSALIRVEVLDAYEAATRQAKTRKPGTLPTLDEGR